jgi:hypothetical protein
MNRLQRLRDAGVSIWLDTLSRELLDSGAFAELGARLSPRRNQAETADEPRISSQRRQASFQRGKSHPFQRL